MPLPMLIVPVACYRDNYAYLVARDKSSDAILIDPCEAEPIEHAVAQHGFELRGVLCTHHHGDHVDGIEELVESRAQIPVFVHSYDQRRIPCVTNTVEHGDTVELAGLQLHAVHVPGHTLGALAWVVGDAVFSGDTLFLGGSGRVFEGTVPMMLHSLEDGFATLPPATRVFCGHEYTEPNLVFAAHVEPGNEDVQERLGLARRLRTQHLPTVPGLLADELGTNPFLRCREPAVIEFALAHGAPSPAPEDVFAAVRNAKNSFRG